MTSDKAYIQERIERAKWLLSNIKHAAMATVNEDGSPHNTPYFFMRSDDLKELYWGSHPDSVHSQNVGRTGQIFVVLYEANERGGLYIKCENARVAEGQELERALEAHNLLRAKYGMEALPIDYYREPNGQRMYIADTVAFWINYAERNKEGRISQDRRKEVAREDLV